MKKRSRHFIVVRAAAWLGVLGMLLAACTTAPSQGGGTSPGVQPGETGAKIQPSLTPIAAGSNNSVPGAGGLATQAGNNSIALPFTSKPAGSGLAALPGLPDPQSAQWKPLNLNLPDVVGIANAGDGSGRLFALIRSGTIRVIQIGQLVDAPFLDITNLVDSQGTEQGLLGLAFHPHYAQNGYFYVYYTNLSGSDVIARYHVSSDPNRADPASEQIILQIPKPFPNHNGGSVVFGPDGLLYLGVGDGGSEGDPLNNGQSTQTLLGKLLRIDVDHGSPYTIPPDNPFVKGGGKAEIWAYGLRNPWRFSFDSRTGDLYIADVGQDLYEEIDFLPAGSRGGTNFGWRYREGMHPYRGTPPAGVTLTDPVYEYDHSQGCAEIGGYVYRGKVLPSAWQGVYIFGDYCTGNVWGLLHKPDGTWEGKILFQTDFAISSFGTDEQGEIYLADQHGGVYQLAPG